MLKKLVFLVPLILVLPIVSSQEITNPEAVSYLHAEVNKSGYVYLFDNSPFQTARELRITLAIPQNTSRQTSLLKKVEGPEKYEITEDIWGNKIISLYWGTPELKKKLYYTVVSDVEVFDKEVMTKNMNFPVTGFTKSNPDIDKKAYGIGYGLDDMQRLFRLTEWVHENVRYDNSAKSFSQSAEWTYQNRIGTCDEFSNLLASMLRVLDYNPRYVVGYAYSENWGQHSWVEVDYNGRTVSLDPTWLESPVDSTHIELASLPDSNFSEHAEVRGGQITIDWNKEEAEVKLISFNQSAKIDIGATLIPENSSDGSYSLLSTEFISHPECVLTSVQIKSCIKQSGESLLSISRSNQTLAFCGKEEAYWFLKSPEIESGLLYTCPVIIYGGGAEKTVSATVESGLKKMFRTAVNSQNVLTPGQTFEVKSLTENLGHSTESAIIYVFFAGLTQNKDFTLKPNQQAEIKWTLKAPAKPGDYDMVVFSSSGELVNQNITVVSQRHAQIDNISAPTNVQTNQEFAVNVTVKALTSFSGVLKTVIGDYNSTKWVFLGPSESKTFSFFYNPQSPGAKTISITLLSDSQQYEDGWWGTLDVQNEKQWWDYITEWFEGIIDWVVGIFTGRS